MSGNYQDGVSQADIDRAHDGGDEDPDLFIDPQEFVIERFGHRRYYTTHTCPKCEQESECKTNLCRLESTIECLPCLTRELLEDTVRFAKEARQFLKTPLPTDEQMLPWWRSLRQGVDGKLKGLVTRAEEVMKRQDQI